MFILIAVVLSIGSFYEMNRKPRNYTALFYILSALLTCMLCFRYGQGTDYHSYEIQYSVFQPSASIIINPLHHGELGWAGLLTLAHKLRITFQSYIAILSAVMMAFSTVAIKKFSPYPVSSLLLMYPTYFLTFYYSAIRQGLVVSLFLGIGLSLLHQKKYARFYALVICLVLIHKSALILLLLPFFLKFHQKAITLKKQIAFAIIAFLGYSGMFDIIVTKFGIESYLRVSISVPAILIRVILFYVIYKLHSYAKNYSEDSVEVMLYSLYHFGFILYILLAFASTLSQRLTMPLKAIECLLIPIELYRVNETRRNHLKAGASLWMVKIRSCKVAFLALLVVLMMNVETIKNVNSYIYQGNYASWVTPLNYPYISIFNKEKIYGYISHFDGEIRN